MAFDNEKCVECIGIIDSVFAEYNTLKTAKRELQKIIDVVVPEQQVVDSTQPSGFRVVAASVENPQEHGKDIPQAKRGERQKYYHDILTAALDRLHALELAEEPAQQAPPTPPNS